MNTDLAVRILNRSLLIQDIKRGARAKVRTEALREIVRLALELRLGPLDAMIMPLLDAADEVTLHEVVAHMGPDAGADPRAPWLTEAERWRARMRRPAKNTDILDESPLIQSFQRVARTEALRDVVRFSIEVRFGSLDEALATALGAADETALTHVIAHVATDTLNELHTRFVTPRD